MTPRTKLLLLGIVLLAAVLRFAALDSIPPGIYPDEALNGVEGYRAATTGDFKVFYPTNNGREGLWINLIGIVVKTLGPSQFSLRLLSALVGVLTVLGLFFVARKLFANFNVIPAKAGIQDSGTGSRVKPGMTESERIALLAALFLATSFWHLNFSRIAFRAINVPLLTVWCFYFLLKAWERRSYLYFALAGAIFGIGFHTYIAYRIAPLLLLIFFILKLKDFRLPGAWRLTKGVAVFLATAGIVIAPMLLYLFRHQEDLLKRDGAKIGVFQQASPITELAKSIGKTAIMFNVRGDCNWRHNFPCKPELPLASGLLFLVGVWVALKAVFKKNTQAENFFPHAFTLAWFLAFLIPEVLTSEGIPHALRAIGVLPPVMMLAALGAWHAYAWADNIASHTKRTIAHTLLVIGIVHSIGIGPYQYFGPWAHNAKTAKEFTQHYVHIAEYIKTSVPQSTPVYVVTNEGDVNIDGVSVHAQTIKYLLLDAPGIAASVTYANPAQFFQHIPTAPGSIIIPLKPDERIFDDLRKQKLDIMVVSFKDFQVGTVE